MNKKNILIVCPYPEGFAASQRLKYEQYFESWKESGYDITIRPYFDKKAWKVLYEDSSFLLKAWATILGYLKRIVLLREVGKFDVVYVCMWVTPFLDWILESLFIRLSKRLVFDFDDSIHREIDPNIEKFYKRLFKGRKKIRYLIKNANHVITSSPFNLEDCAEMNNYSKATYIPCTLDTKRFIPANEKFGKQLTVGWTGTFSTKKYIDSISHSLKEACLEHDLKLLLITNFEYDIPGLDIEIIRWNKETEIEDLQKIDIGIYPLDITNWTLGKGGLKVLQYMSIGIPSISTNYGTATKIVDHGVDGFLASSMEDWKKYLSLLANDAKLRTEIGKNGREKVLSNYSITANYQKYLTILNGDQTL